MNKMILVLAILILTAYSASGQFEYAASKEYPYGQYNPAAPEQLKDYEDLIGVCDCKSVSRKPDGTWAGPVKMKWTWQYIMNGMGVQDYTLKEDGTHSGSIRQYDKDSLQWNVHYYTSRRTSAVLPVWTGNKKDGKIVLYREQKAPNGTEGFFRLSFYDISKKGYKWIGEWVDISETVVFPTWKIECTRE